MMHLYRLLLRLYPPDHCAEFGEEMVSVFREVQQGSRAAGLYSRIMFCAREISGLIAGALRERIRGQYRALKGGYMRSFRFPVWMIVLMLMLLLSVIVAIDKTLQVSTGSVNGGSTWLVLPGLIVFGVAFFGVVALIGYGLLYVLRKAGVQRLSDIQIPPHRN